MTQKPVAYLRDLQPDAEDEALAVCINGDPGSFPVYAAEWIYISPDCVHQPNPTDKSRWDIAPGKRKQFQKLIATIKAG